MESGQKEITTRLATKCKFLSYRSRRVLIFWAFLWRLDRRKKDKRGKKGTEAGISSGGKEIKNKETRGSGLETNDQGIISEKEWKGES